MARIELDQRVGTGPIRFRRPELYGEISSGSQGLAQGASEQASTIEEVSSSLHEIFGSPDDLKFRSCMTLFDAVAPARDNIFAHALERFCGGERDDRTLALLTKPS